MKYIVLIVVLIFAALAGGWLYFNNKHYNVVITQQQIDKALQQKFPLTKTHLLIFQVTYSNPRLTLLPELNRIEVGLDATVHIKLPSDPKQFSGTILATSTLTYRSDKQQFFLSDPEIKKIEIQGVPQKYIDKVTEVSSTAAREYLEILPVYTLTPKDTKTAAAKLLLKDVQVKNSEIHLTLGL